MHTLIRQLDKLPPTEIGEIFDRRLHVRRLPSPRRSYSMGLFSAIVSEALCAHDRSHCNWWLLRKPELRTSESIMVPSFGGWRKSTLPTLPEYCFDTPCDWIAELVNFDSPRDDTARRFDIFAELGTTYYWLINPRKQLLSCYRNQNKHWTLVKEVQSEPVRSVPPFNDIVFDFTPVWEFDV